ncbi:MAG: MCE family protein [Solirubrobacterales bacterium]|nr:MCE family protein [Solirubrobacterales bacterium]
MPNVLAGLVALALIAVVTYFGFTKSVPFRDHFEVKAAFRSANNIRPDSPVRIAGVTVGKVTRVERGDPGASNATVVLRIDKKGLPIHEDATAAIRPRIFLEGNFFVDLQPGSPSAKALGDGDTIPVNQTSSPVQIDQVLTTLQADTRKQLQTLLDEYSRGISGEGADGFRRSTKYWEPAYRDGAIVADAQQGERPHDLSGYIDSAGTVAGALDRNPRQLQDLITDFNATARAFASNDRQLTAAIGELPRTLRAGYSALGALNAAFPATRRLVRDLRPAVRSSGPALEASTPFVRQLRGLVQKSELRGLVADLRPTVPDLARLQRATVPLYEQVRAASSCQNEVILPWTHDKIEDKTFPTKYKVYEEATKPLGGLAGESRSGDANGQWFRVLVGGPVMAYPLGTDRFFLTSAPLLGTNPPKPQARTPLRPDVPCETQERPDLRTVPGPAPEGRRVQISPGNEGKWAAMVEKATDQLRKQVKEQKLDLRVSTKPITKDVLEGLGK